jgi:hypothetical protein
VLSFPPVVHSSFCLNVLGAVNGMPINIFVRILPTIIIE